MCQINFKINTNNISSSPITAAEMQYRKEGESWSSSASINVSNPQTPNITEKGDYELQVRVYNGVWSNWFVSPTNFKIGNCYRVTNLTLEAALHQKEHSTP